MKVDRDVWEGRKPIVDPAFGARSIGPFALISEGCEVWSIPDARRDSHEDPVGGIVLEVTSATHSDGEIVRAFRVYDYLCHDIRRAFRTLAEVEIERDSITAADPGRVTRAIRRMCAELGKRQRSVWTSDDARLACDAYTLSRTLMAGQW